MTPSRPLWIHFIWTFLFLFCLYFLFQYVRNRLRDGDRNGTLMEGMGDTEAAAKASEEGVCVYYPDPNVKNYKRDFLVGDLADESIELYSFVKIDESLVDASNADVTANPGYGEYKQSMTDLAIYKSYHSVANNYDKYAEQLMGKHFDPEHLAEIIQDEKTDKKRSAKIVADFSKDLVQEDTHFQAVLYHCAYLQTNDGSNNTPLSVYFGELVAKYVDTKSQLDVVKKAFFELMRPVALMQNLCDNYEKEETRYQTADGKAGKNDSAIFFLNTMSDLLKKINVEKSNALKINKDRCIHVFTDDKDDAQSKSLPLDAVKIYYYSEFAVRMSRLLPNSTTIQMDKETFAAGFPAYLKKKSGKTEKESLLTYLLKNPPKQMT